MEFCTSRHILLWILILQMITITLRQVFDFLGFMWASVLANFLFTLCIIFGIFGVVQSTIHYTVSYTAGCVFWLTWNVLTVLFYTNTFDINREDDLLSFGTGSVSWWKINGPGCKPIFLANRTSVIEDPLQPIKPDLVANCVVQFHYIEITQALIQLCFAIWGIIFGYKVTTGLKNEMNDGNSVKSSSASKKQDSTVASTLPLYSIQYKGSNHSDDIDDDTSHSGNEETRVTGGSLRPMTPRRVKRRSVNSRGTLGSNSNHRNSFPSSAAVQPSLPYGRRVNALRNSTKSIARKPKQNAVPPPNPPPRFISEQRPATVQQQAFNDSSTSNDSCQVPYPLSVSQSQLLLSPALLNYPSDTLSTNNYNTLNYDAMNYGSAASNYGDARLNYGDGPNNYNNPNYVSCTSLDRPPSVHSGYSNFHGARVISHNPNYDTVARNPRPHSTFFRSGPPAYGTESGAAYNQNLR